MSIKKMIAGAIASIFIINMFSFAIPVSAAGIAPSDAQKAVFKIVTDKQHYDVGEFIKVSFVVENTGWLGNEMIKPTIPYNTGIKAVQAVFDHDGWGKIELQKDRNGADFNPEQPYVYEGYYGDSITNRKGVPISSYVYDFYGKKTDGTVYNTFLIAYDAWLDTAVNPPIYDGEIGYLIFEAKEDAYVNFGFADGTVQLELVEKGNYYSYQSGRVDVDNDVLYQGSRIKIGNPDGTIIPTPTPAQFPVIKSAEVISPTALRSGININSLDNPVINTVRITFVDGTTVGDFVNDPNEANVIGTGTDGNGNVYREYANFSTSAWSGFSTSLINQEQTAYANIPTLFMNAHNISNKNSESITWKFRFQPDYSLLTVDGVKNNKLTNPDKIYFSPNQLIAGDIVYVKDASKGESEWKSFTVGAVTQNNSVEIDIGPSPDVLIKEGGTLQYYVVSGGTTSVTKSYVYPAEEVPVMTADKVITVTVPYGAPWSAVRAQLLDTQQVVTDAGNLNINIAWDNQYIDSILMSVKWGSEWSKNGNTNDITVTLPAVATYPVVGGGSVSLNGHKIQVVFKKTKHIVTGVNGISTQENYGTAWASVKPPTSVTVTSGYGTETFNIKNGQGEWTAVGATYSETAEGQTFTYEILLKNLRDALPVYYDLDSGVTKATWGITVLNQEDTVWTGSVESVVNNRSDGAEPDYITLTGLKDGDKIILNNGSVDSGILTADKTNPGICIDESTGKYKFSLGFSFLNDNGSASSSPLTGTIESKGKKPVSIGAGVAYDAESPYMRDNVTLSDVTVDVGTDWNTVYGLINVAARQNINITTDRTPVGTPAANLNWLTISSNHQYLGTNWDSSKPVVYDIVITPGDTPGAIFASTTPATRNGLATKRTISFKINVVGKKITSAEAVNAGGSTSFSVPFGTSFEKVISSYLPAAIRLHYTDYLSAAGQVELLYSSLTGISWERGNYDGTIATSSVGGTPYRITAKLVNINGIPQQYIKPTSLTPPEADITVEWYVSVNDQLQTDWNANITIVNNRGGTPEDTIAMTGITAGDEVWLKSNRFGAAEITWTVQAGQTNDSGVSYIRGLGDIFLDENGGDINFTVKSENKTVSSVKSWAYNAEQAYMKAHDLGEVKVDVGTNWASLKTKLEVLSSSGVEVDIDRKIGSSLTGNSFTTYVNLDWDSIANDSRINPKFTGWNPILPDEFIVEITPGVTNGAVLADARVINDSASPKKITITIKVEPKKVNLIKGYSETSGGLDYVNVPYGTVSANVPRPKSLELTLADGSTERVDVSALTGLVWDWSVYNRNDSTGPQTIKASLTGVSGISSRYDYSGLTEATWTVNVSSIQVTDWSGTIESITNNRGTPDRVVVTGLKAGDAVNFKEGGVPIITPSLTASQDGRNVFSISDGRLNMYGGSLTVTVTRPDFSESTYSNTLAYSYEQPYMSADYDLGTIDVEVGASYADLIAKINKSSVDVDVDRYAVGSLVTTAVVDLNWNNIASAISTLGNWNVTASQPTTAPITIAIVPGLTSGAVFATSTPQVINFENNKKITLAINVTGNKVVSANGTKDIVGTGTVNSITVPYGTAYTNALLPDTIVLEYELTTGGTTTTVPISVSSLGNLNWDTSAYKSNVSGTYDIKLSLSGVTGIPAKYTNISNIVVVWKITVDSIGKTPWNSNSIVSVTNNRNAVDGTKIEDTIKFANVQNGDKVVISNVSTLSTMSYEKLDSVAPDGTVTLSLGESLLSNDGGTIRVTIQRVNHAESDPQTFIYKSEAPWVRQTDKLTLPVIYVDVGTSWAAASSLLPANVTVDVDRKATNSNAGTPYNTVNVTPNWVNIAAENPTTIGAGGIVWNSNSNTPKRVIVEFVPTAFATVTDPVTTNPHMYKIVQEIVINPFAVTSAVALDKTTGLAETVVDYNTPKSNITLPEKIEFAMDDGSNTTQEVSIAGVLINSSSWTGFYNPAEAVDGDKVYTFTLDLKYFREFIPALAKYNIDQATWTVRVKQQEPTQIGLAKLEVINEKGTILDRVKFTDLPYNGKALKLTVNSDNGVSPVVINNVNSTTYEGTLPAGFLKIEGGNVSFVIEEINKKPTDIDGNSIVKYDREQPWVTKLPNELELHADYGMTWTDLRAELVYYFSEILVEADKNTPTKSMWIDLTWQGSYNNNRTEWEKVNTKEGTVFYAVPVVGAITDDESRLQSQREGYLPNDISIAVKVIVGNAGASTAPNGVKVVNRYQSADNRAQFEYETNNKDTIITFYSKVGDTYSKIDSITLTAQTGTSIVDYHAAWLSQAGGEFAVTARRAGESESSYTNVAYGSYVLNVVAVDDIEIVAGVDSGNLNAPANELPMYVIGTLENGAKEPNIAVDGSTWKWYDSNNLSVEIPAPTDYSTAGSYEVKAGLGSLRTGIGNFDDVQVVINFKILEITKAPVIADDSMGTPIATMQNEKGSVIDTLTITSLEAGDVIRMYGSTTDTQALVTFSSVSSAGRRVFELGKTTESGWLSKNGGTYYITRQSSGKAESAKVKIDYLREVPYMNKSVRLSDITIEFGADWDVLEAKLPAPLTPITVSTDSGNMYASLDWSHVEPLWNSHKNIAGAHTYTAVITSIYDGKTPNGDQQGETVYVTVFVKTQTDPAPIISDITHINRPNYNNDSITVKYNDFNEDVIIKIYRKTSIGYDLITSGGTGGKGSVTFNPIPGGFDKNYIDTNIWETVYATATKPGQSESEMTAHLIGDEQSAITSATSQVSLYKNAAVNELLTKLFAGEVSVRLEGGTAAIRTDVKILGSAALSSFKYDDGTGNLITLNSTKASSMLSTEGDYTLYASIDTAQLSSGIVVGHDPVRNSDVMISFKVVVATPGSSVAPVITQVINNKGNADDEIIFSSSNLAVGDIIKVYYENTSGAAVKYTSQKATAADVAANKIKITDHAVLSKTGGMIYVTRTTDGGPSESTKVGHGYSREVPYMTENMTLVPVTVPVGTAWNDVVTKIQAANLTPKVKVDTSGNSDGMMFADLDYASALVAWNAVSGTAGEHTIVIPARTSNYPPAGIYDNKLNEPNGENPNGRTISVKITAQAKSDAPEVGKITVTNNPTGVMSDTIRVEYDDKGLFVEIRVYFEDPASNPSAEPVVLNTRGQKFVEMTVSGGLSNSANPADRKIWVTAKALDYAESDSVEAEYDIEKKAITRIEADSAKIGMNIQLANVISGYKPDFVKAYDGATLVETIDVRAMSIVWEEDSANPYNANAVGVYKLYGASGNVALTDTTYMIPSTVKVEWSVEVASIKTDALTENQITIVNNRAPNKDTLTIDSSYPVVTSDVVKLYKDNGSGSYDEYVCTESNGNVRWIDDGFLLKSSGAIYVTITKSGRAESDRTYKTYAAEQPYITSVSNPIASIEVPMGVLFSDLLLGATPKVPSRILVPTDTVGNQSVDVTWNSAAYNRNVEGTYTISVATVTSVNPIYNIIKPAGINIEMTIKVMNQAKSPADMDISIINDPAADKNVFIKDSQTIHVKVYDKDPSISGAVILAEGDIVAGELNFKLSLSPTGGSLWFVAEQTGKFASAAVEKSYDGIPYEIYSAALISGTEYIKAAGTDKTSDGFYPEYVIVNLTNPISGVTLYAKVDSGAWTESGTPYNKDVPGPYKFTAQVDLSTIYEFDGTDYKPNTHGVWVSEITQTPIHINYDVVVSSTIVKVLDDVTLESVEVALGTVFEDIKDSDGNGVIKNSYTMPTNLGNRSVTVDWTAAKAEYELIDNTSLPLSEPITLKAVPMKDVLTGVNVENASYGVIVEVMIKDVTVPVDGDKIDVINNKTPLKDEVKVEYPVDGAVIIVYDKDPSEDDAIEIGRGTVESGKATITLDDDLEDGSGSIWIVAQEDDKIAADAVSKGYSGEIQKITADVDLGVVTVPQGSTITVLEMLYPTAEASVTGGEGKVTLPIDWSNAKTAGNVDFDIYASTPQVVAETFYVEFELPLPESIINDNNYQVKIAVLVEAASKALTDGMVQITYDPSGIFANVITISGYNGAEGSIITVYDKDGNVLNNPAYNKTVGGSVTITIDELPPFADGEDRAYVVITATEPNSGESAPLTKYYFGQTVTIISDYVHPVAMTAGTTFAQIEAAFAGFIANNGTVAVTARDGSGTISTHNVKIDSTLTAAGSYPAGLTAGDYDYTASFDLADYPYILSGGKKFIFRVSVGRTDAPNIGKIAVTNNDFYSVSDTVVINDVPSGYTVKLYVKKSASEYENIPVTPTRAGNTVTFRLSDPYKSKLKHDGYDGLETDKKARVYLTFTDTASGNGESLYTAKEYASENWIVIQDVVLSTQGSPILVKEGITVDELIDRLESMKIETTVVAGYSPTVANDDNMIVKTNQRVKAEYTALRQGFDPALTNANQEFLIDIAGSAETFGNIINLTGAYKKYIKVVVKILGVTEDFDTDSVTIINAHNLDAAKNTSIIIDNINGTDYPAGTVINVYSDSMGTTLLATYTVDADDITEGKIIIDKNRNDGSGTDIALNSSGGSVYISVERTGEYESIPVEVTYLPVPKVIASVETFDDVMDGDELPVDIKITLDDSSEITVEIEWEDISGVTPTQELGADGKLYDVYEISGSFKDLDGSEVINPTGVEPKLKVKVPVVSGDIDADDIAINNYYDPAGGTIEIDGLEDGDIIRIYADEDGENLLAEWVYDGSTNIFDIPAEILDDEGGNVWVTVEKENKAESEPVEVEYDSADSYPSTWTLVLPVELVDDIVEVNFGTSIEDVIKELTDTITVVFNTGDGTKEVTLTVGQNDFEIIWDESSIYNSEIAGIYTIEGEIVIPGVDTSIAIVKQKVEVKTLDPSDPLNMTGVAVENNKAPFDDKLIIPVTALTNGDKISVYHFDVYNGILGEVIRKDVEYTEKVGFSVFEIVLEHDNAHPLSDTRSGTLMVSRKSKGMGESVTSSIGYSASASDYPEWEVTGVLPLANVVVDYNTSVAGLEAELATEFTVNFKNAVNPDKPVRPDSYKFVKGTTGFSIVWNTSTYNPSVEGTQIITGTITLPGKLNDKNGTIAVQQNVIVGNMKDSVRITSGITVHNYLSPFKDEVEIDVATAGILEGDIVRVYSDYAKTNLIGQSTAYKSEDGSMIYIDVTGVSDTVIGTVFVTRQSKDSKESVPPFAVDYEVAADYPEFTVMSIKTLDDIRVPYDTPEDSLSLANVITVSGIETRSNTQYNDITFTNNVNGFGIVWDTTGYVSQDVGTRQEMTAIITWPLNITPDISLPVNVSDETIVSQYVIILPKDVSAPISVGDISVSSDWNGTYTVTIDSSNIVNGDKIIVYSSSDIKDENKLGEIIYNGSGNAVISISDGDGTWRASGDGSIYVIRVETDKDLSPATEVELPKLRVVLSDGNLMSSDGITVYSKSKYDIDRAEGRVNDLDPKTSVSMTNAATVLMHYEQIFKDPGFTVVDADGNEVAAGKYEVIAILTDLDGNELARVDNYSGTILDFETSVPNPRIIDLKDGTFKIKYEVLVNGVQTQADEYVRYVKLRYLRGDVNGDGNIDISDLDLVAKHLLEIYDNILGNLIKNNDILGMVINLDGKGDVAISNLTLMARHILGDKFIEQDFIDIE